MTSKKIVRSANSNPLGQDDVSLEHFADGVMVLDHDLTIVAFSEGAQRITGYRADEVTGRHCHELFHAEVCDSDCPAKETLSSGKVLTNVYYSIYTKDDDEIPICASTVPLKNADGETTGVVETFRNVAEVRDLLLRDAQLGEQVLTERAKLSAILDSIAEGVFTVDLDLRVTTFNKAAERITGFRAEEVIGKPCRTVFHSTVCRDSCPVKETIRTGKPVRDYEFEIFSKSNRVVPVSVSTGLLLDEAEQVFGAVETFRDMSQVRELTEQLQEKYSFENIVGKSPVMRRIFGLIPQVASADTTVLVVGETGTGKELVARAIHYHSPRRDKRFMAINCAAIPEALLESELFGHVKGAFTDAVSDRKGKFEVADGGTVFLDEVAEMSPALQAKLLRFIETREFDRVGDTESVKVDVRIIAATNRDLEVQVGKNKFREDLYYRLNVLPIKLPPLRERKEDIPVLIEYFITMFNQKSGRHVTGIAPDALESLLAYQWRGNVRELENAIEHAFIHCHGGNIKLAHLPEGLSAPGAGAAQRMVRAAKPFEASEKAVLLAALRKHAWNQTRTAESLGISRSSLWRKMKKHGIRPEDRARITDR
jgi:PAS domain S-box-containing protein